MWHIVSGFFCGCIALNCKVTAAAILPFLLLWIFWQRHIAQQLHYFAASTQYHTFNGIPSHDDERLLDFTSLKERCLDVLYHCVAFIAGVLIGHGPWLIVHKVYTGRVLPNAWPSATMLRTSAFVRAAVNKPWHTYLSMLARLAPGYLLGLLFVLLFVVYILLVQQKRFACLVLYPQKLGLFQRQFPYLPQQQQQQQGSHLVSQHSEDHWDAAVLVPVITLLLSVWPLAFLLSLTALGSLGAGYQSRFLLPALPGLAIVASSGIEWLTQRLPLQQQQQQQEQQLQQEEEVLRPCTRCCSEQQVAAAAARVAAVRMCFSLAVMYGTCNAFYYGVLYAPLFAELDVSSIDIIQTVLEHTSHQPASRQSFEDTLRFMLHYGLNRASQ